MVDPNVVRLAVEYLDSCLSAGAEATLVGMHWHIDGRNKTLPLLDEVNEALRQRPELRVTHHNGGIVFSLSGVATAVTSDDMKLADKLYRREFSAKLRELRGDA